MFSGRGSDFTDAARYGAACAAVDRSKDAHGRRGESDAAAVICDGLSREHYAKNMH